MQSRQAGFSLIETLTMLSIFGILSAMAVVQIGQTVPQMKADGAMRVVVGQLNAARELAISQRRYMQVRFVAPNQIQVVRTNVNTSGTVTGTTVLSSITFEGGITYGKASGLIDTPDGFGIPDPVSFGTATTIQFATDGMLVNQAGTPLNGTVLLVSGTLTNSSRAITVFGSTGRVRAYRWTGSAWTLV